MIEGKCPLCRVELEKGKPWIDYKHLWCEHHKERAFSRTCWSCGQTHRIDVKVEFYHMGSALLGECDYE